MEFTKIAIELIDQEKPQVAKRILSYQNDEKAIEVIDTIHELLKVYSIDWVFSTPSSTVAKDIIEECLVDNTPIHNNKLTEEYYLKDFKPIETVEEKFYFVNSTVIEDLLMLRTILDNIGMKRFLKVMNREKQLVLLTIAWLKKPCTSREIYKHSLRLRSYFNLEEDIRWVEEYSNRKNKMYQILATNASLLKRTGLLERAPQVKGESTRMKFKLTEVGWEVVKLINLNVKGPLEILEA